MAPSPMGSRGGENVASPIRKRRVPQLKYTDLRGVGWHVSYRDPKTGVPRKVRFDAVSKAEAERAYHAWVVAFLDGDARVPEKLAASSKKPKGESKKPRPIEGASKVAAHPGSIAHVASGLIRYETDRAREESGGRSSGTIAPRVLLDRKKAVKDFLAFLNERHGPGAAGRMQLVDLDMADVESYNRQMVEAELSASTVNRKMQVVKRIIDRAGRPEYGQQVLSWNWDSMDRLTGKRAKKKQLPTKKQLEKLLAAADARGRAMIWMGIGLGFGQSDLSNIRVGQIDKNSYDLRRGKTGIERYGDTPPGVWKAITEYLGVTERPKGELLFVTSNGRPLVHTRSDSVFQWWNRLRESVGEDKDSMEGFYVLRHLGATEFGSRPGCSIVAMKRWLGHSASSQMADRYMKPVSPEDREVVEWVRKGLAK